MDHRTSLATESLDRLASREGVAESVGGASEKKGIILTKLSLSGQFARVGCVPT